VSPGNFRLATWKIFVSILSGGTGEAVTQPDHGGDESTGSIEGIKSKGVIRPREATGFTYNQSGFRQNQARPPRKDKTFGRQTENRGSLRRKRGGTQRVKGRHRRGSQKTFQIHEEVLREQTVGGWFAGVPHSGKA
jgi:hypothetical protein